MCCRKGAKCIALGQRVAPSDAGKTPEVRVSGMNFGIVFRCHSGDVRISNQIVIASRDRNILPENVQMICTGIQWNYVAQRKPTHNVVQSILPGKRRP